MPFSYESVDDSLALNYNSDGCPQLQPYSAQVNISKSHPDVISIHREKK